MKMLENEEDVKIEKTILEEALEEVGAKVLFGVKFHPEFMPIECCYR